METHICPWWIGFFLASPLRRLWQDPEEILRPHLRPGMTALDIGCAMGFFSIPMATMVGNQGRVICVDVQERMIKSLKKRARKAGVIDRLETHLSPRDTLQVSRADQSIDFALAFAMVHETQDVASLFREVFRLVVPGGRLLLAEPRGHVSRDAFADTTATAEANGWRCHAELEISRSWATLLEK